MRRSIHKWLSSACIAASLAFWCGSVAAADVMFGQIASLTNPASTANAKGLMVGANACFESINARGGDAFADYQVPLAILALQQGLGRLIRHRTDRGVLAILDPRLRTMGYGRRFLESLPPAPVTQDLAAVERFFI